MAGERAEALEDFVAEDGAWVGLVRTHGELWRARSAESVHTGEALEVRRQEGLTLQVAAAEPPSVP
jgi:membrane-bound ClpP family serine protease